MPAVAVSLFVWFCLGASTMRAEIWAREYVGRYPAPATRVVLEVAHGMIEIANAPVGGEVVVVTRLRAQGPGGQAAPIDETDRSGAAEAAERVFARLAPRVKSTTGELQVRVADSRGVVFDWDPALQMAVEVTVAMPPGLDLRVRGMAVAVTLPDVFHGNADVRGESGAITAGRVEGDVVARSGTGGITVSEVTGRGELRSDTGLVLAGRLHGPARLRTLNGAIEVQQVHGTLAMRGSDAELVLGISSPPSKSIDLRTSAGRILINIDRDVALSVDADSRLLGHVRSRGFDESKVDVLSATRSSLVAALNGGGSLLRARTSGGEIVLAGRESIDLEERGRSAP